MSEKKNEPRRSNFESIEILRSKVKDGTFREILEDWKWIFSYSKKYKGAIAFYVVLGILSSTVALASSVATKYLIDIIIEQKTQMIGWLAAIMVGGLVFSLVFNGLVSAISAKIAIDVHNDIQADIFERIMDADWLAMSNYSSGDILNRFNGDVSMVSSNAISWLPTVIISAYNFTATFLVLFYYDWIMAVLALVSAPVLLLMSKTIAKKQREYGTRMRQMSSSMMTFEAETFYNYDTVKSFGISRQYGGKMRQWQKKYRKLALEYNWFSIKTTTMITLLNSLVQMLAFGYCVFQLWNGGITYGTMTLFLQQRSKLSSAFHSVLSVVPSFLDASVSAHRIRELVELPMEGQNEGCCVMDEYAEEGLGICMEDVHFGYVEGQSVIQKSDFLACPGEIIGLVGPSGEGKTTMIRLILGLISPEEGKASLVAGNGHEVTLQVETRHLFSYVPQGNTIISGTIAENLRMVKEDALDEELVEALKAACAWEFVTKLPKGIHTNVGERGKGLSEGQAQRVAIARALLRNAPILLLDEATSALDATTERQVLQNIMERCPNKTCIVTTHRPSVLNLCKRVYRVKDASVTELDEKEAGRLAMDY